MLESPEMFRNVGNQSFSHQQGKTQFQHQSKNGTPMRGMKKVPSRPTSAQSGKGNKNILPNNINPKTG